MGTMSMPVPTMPGVKGMTSAAHGLTRGMGGDVQLTLELGAGPIFRDRLAA